MSTTTEDTATQAQQAPPPVPFYSGSQIVKPVRTLRKVAAAAIKPTQMVPDESGNDQHTYYLVYVTEAGNEHRDPCTYEVWRKANGYPTPRATAPTTKGYKGLINCRFLIGFAEKDASVSRLVTSVDIIHLIPPIISGVRRVDLEGVENITVLVDPYSGELAIEKYPQSMHSRYLNGLIVQLDKTGIIHPGQRLGDYEVTSVNGMRAEVMPPAK